MAQSAGGDFIVRNVRLRGRGSRCDIEVVGGRIRAIGPLPPSGLPHRDMTERSAVPAFVEPHIHLDKVFTADVGTAKGLADASALLGDRLGEANDCAARATRMLELLLAAGVGVVRSQVNIGPRQGLRNLETLLDVANAYADCMTVQFVAFATHEMEPGSRHWHLLDRAVDMGCVAVGGGTTRRSDPHRFVDALCELAARRQVQVDLHVDEHLAPHCDGLEALIAGVERHGLEGQAIAAHCCSLGILPSQLRKRMIDALAEKSVTVCALPLTNLFLQRQDTSFRAVGPRGIAPVSQLLDAGVRVICGSDNVRDPYLPYGNGDPLLVLTVMAITGQLLSARERSWLEGAMTDGAAMALDIDRDGLSIGQTANFVVLDQKADRYLDLAPNPRALVVMGGKIIGGTRAGLEA